jgi:spectinomycin phosphotransferase
VLTAPDDLDTAALAAVLERHWGLQARPLEYLPIGFGSHHWRAVDAGGVEQFVTVDDLEAGFQAGPDADAAFAALDRAYRTAAWLRDEAGLDFVLAPLPAADGAAIRRLDARYAVTVRPFVAGETSGFDRYEDVDDRRLVAGIVGRLHAVTGRVPPGLPRRDDLAVPARPELEAALAADLERPWDAGPFAEPARRLLADSAETVRWRLREYDELVAAVRASPEQWVLTHGEPHRANVIRASDGRLFLIDWDTTLIAPRERDLRMLLDDDLTGWEEYVAAGGPASLNPDALELYRRWWDLADIAVFLDVCHRPHERTDHTAAAFETLAKTLAGVA